LDNASSWWRNLRSVSSSVSFLYESPSSRESLDEELSNGPLPTGATWTTDLSTEPTRKVVALSTPGMAGGSSSLSGSRPGGFNRHLPSAYDYERFGIRPSSLGVEWMALS
jgi:hypothetical protein